MSVCGEDNKGGVFWSSIQGLPTGRLQGLELWLLLSLLFVCPCGSVSMCTGLVWFPPRASALVFTVVVCQYILASFCCAFPPPIPLLPPFRQCSGTFPHPVGPKAPSDSPSPPSCPTGAMPLSVLPFVPPGPGPSPLSSGHHVLAGLKI